MTRVFTDKIGRDIAEKFMQKGWNIYQKRETPFLTLDAGPVSTLEETKYVVLPSRPDPRNLGDVVSAARMMGTPYIHINAERVLIEEEPDGNTDIRTLHPGENIIFTGFSVTPRNFQFISEWRLILPYETVVNCLEGLADASKIKVPDKRPLTWEEVETFDEVINLLDRKLISELEIQEPCPHLRLSGQFWHFCGMDMRKMSYKKPSPEHPVYKRHVEPAELQLFCDGNFKNCIYFTGQSKH